MFRDGGELVYDPVSGRMVSKAVQETIGSADSQASASPAVKSNKNLVDDVAGLPSKKEAEATPEESFRSSEAESWKIQHQEPGQCSVLDKSESAFSQMRVLNERLDRLGRAKDAMSKRRARDLDHHQTTEDFYQGEKEFWAKQYKREQAIGFATESSPRSVTQDESHFPAQQTERKAEADEKPIATSQGSVAKPWSDARDAFAQRRQDFNSRFERPVLMSTPFEDAERNDKLRKAVDAWRNGAMETRRALVEAQHPEVSVSDDQAASSKHPLEDAGSGCSKRTSIMQTQQREWESLSDNVERQAAKKHTARTQRPPATDEAWRKFKSGKPFQPTTRISRSGGGYQGITHDSHAFLSIFRKDKPLKQMSSLEFKNHRAAITGSFQRRQRNVSTTDPSLAREVELQKQAMKAFEDKWHWRQENKAAAGPTVVEGESDMDGNVLRSAPSENGYTSTTAQSNDPEGRQLVEAVRSIYESAYGRITPTHRQGKLEESLQEFECTAPSPPLEGSCEPINDVEERHLDAALGDYDSQRAQATEDDFSELSAAPEESALMDAALGEYEVKSAVQEDDIGQNAEPWRLESAIERMAKESRPLKLNARRQEALSRDEKAAASKPPPSSARSSSVVELESGRSKPVSTADTEKSRPRQRIWGINPSLQPRPSAATSQDVGHVGNTGRGAVDHPTPQIGNFASPTGFVNHDFPAARAASSEAAARSTPQASPKQRIVRRDEVVFSGQLPSQKQSTAEIVNHLRRKGFEDTQLPEDAKNPFKHYKAARRAARRHQRKQQRERRMKLPWLAAIATLVGFTGAVAYAIGACIESYREKVRERAEPGPRVQMLDGNWAEAPATRAPSIWPFLCVGGLAGLMCATLAIVLGGRGGA